MVSPGFFLHCLSSCTQTLHAVRDHHSAKFHPALRYVFTPAEEKLRQRANSPGDCTIMVWGVLLIHTSLVGSRCMTWQHLNYSELSQIVQRTQPECIDPKCRQFLQGFAFNPSALRSICQRRWQLKSVAGVDHSRFVLHANWNCDQGQGINCGAQTQRTLLVHPSPPLWFVVCLITLFDSPNNDLWFD